MTLNSAKDMPREIRTAGRAMYDVNVNIKFKECGIGAFK